MLAIRQSGYYNQVWARDRQDPISRKPIGLVINFGEQKVEIKRKVKDLDPEDPVNPVKKNL